MIDNRVAGAGDGGMNAVAANIPVSSLLTVDNLSLSTNKQSILKLVKQVGTLSVSIGNILIISFIRF